MFRQEHASSQWAFDKKLPNTDEANVTVAKCK